MSREARREARSGPPVGNIAVFPDVGLNGVVGVEAERVPPRRGVRLAGPGREEHPLLGAPPGCLQGDAHPRQDSVRRVREAVPEHPILAEHLEVAAVLEHRRVAAPRGGPRGGVGGPEQRRGGSAVGRGAVEDAELAGGGERERRQRRGGRRDAVGDPDDGPRRDAVVPDAEVLAGGLLGVRREEARLEHPLRRGHQRRRPGQRLPLPQRVRRLRRRHTAAQAGEEQEEEPRRGGHGGETEHSSPWLHPHHLSFSPGVPRPGPIGRGHGHPESTNHSLHSGERERKETVKERERLCRLSPTAAPSRYPNLPTPRRFIARKHSPTDDANSRLILSTTWWRT